MTGRLDRAARLLAAPIRTDRRFGVRSDGRWLSPNSRPGTCGGLRRAAWRMCRSATQSTLVLAGASEDPPDGHPGCRHRRPARIFASGAYISASPMHPPEVPATRRTARSAAAGCRCRMGWITAGAAGSEQDASSCESTERQLPDGHAKPFALGDAVHYRAPLLVPLPGGS